MALDIVVHKNILIKILKDIFTDIRIGPILGFKGGTAAYLFYDLDRFSVDLDFDLLDESKSDAAFERIGTILRGYGRLKREDKKRYTFFYLLSYIDKDINAQNIKVEINRRNFNSTFDMLAYLGISMNVMVKEDMAAHKLVALFERSGRANRDIYDVHYFLKQGWPINHSMIKNRTGMEARDFYMKCLEILESIDGKQILAGMGELLSAKKKDWVKNHLVSDTIFLLNLQMSNLD